MAARKGQGTTQRGKQRARKRPVPELSPPQSSSDEESWPIWQKLQQRMDALGGARAGQAPAAQGGRQPRRSTRDARGHRRAKLRALAQDIHNKLAVLEAELQTDDASEDATAPSERSTETEVPTASESEASSAAARGSNGAPGGGNIVETPTLQGSDATVQGAGPTGQRGSGDSSSGGLVNWREDAERVINMALAPRTRRGYSAVSKEFHKFRESVGLDQIWPVPVDHLQQFIISLHRQGLAPGTIQGRLSALAFQAKARGFPDFSSDFRIRKMIEGLYKERGRAMDTRAPISLELLKGIGHQLGTICRDEYEVSLFRAAALVMFFAALRISEVVAGGKGDRSRAALQMADVQNEDGAMRLHIRRSKTDQWGKGAWVTLAPCHDVGLCPVRAMEEYLTKRGAEPGYLFIHRDSSPLTKYQFWKLTEEALRKEGAQGQRFGTHSFRIGAASTAAVLGYQPMDIKRIGRWASKSYRRYIRPLPNA
uniref:Uncharacterized protein isoform X1 n=1 Tax=Pogona vitticeps TaxID=103695 RepID=A0ABM5GF58_9SAUR